MQQIIVTSILLVKDETLEKLLIPGEKRRIMRSLRSRIFSWRLRWDTHWEERCSHNLDTGFDTEYWVQFPNVTQSCYVPLSAPHLQNGGRNTSLPSLDIVGINP